MEDPSEELEQRKRFGLGALIIGVALFVGEILGSYSGGGVAMLFFGLKSWFAGGGRIHM
jgi:hypothetical protein